MRLYAPAARTKVSSRGVGHTRDTAQCLSRTLTLVMLCFIKGVAQVVWIRILRTTCCSQFDSNAESEAQASEVSTVRIAWRGRIFEIFKSRKMVSV